MRAFDELASISETSIRWKDRKPPFSVWERNLSLNSVLKLFLLSVVVSASAAPAFADSTSKERSRLEELFIWKTSEELKLDPKVEIKFTETIHSLNTRRRAANTKMDAALASLAQAKTKDQAEKALNAHRAALREVQAVQTTEIEKLRPLLGPEKLAQYIVVKSSILEKLKTMLAAPGPQAPQAPPAQASTASSTTVTPAATPSPKN